MYAQRDCPLEPDDGGNDRNEQVKFKESGERNPGKRYPCLFSPQYFILVGGRVDLGESTARSYVYTVAEGGNKELEEQPEACRPVSRDNAPIN